MEYGVANSGIPPALAASMTSAPGALVSNENDGENTGNLRRPDRLDRSQPGHEEYPVGRPDQDVTHQIAGTAEYDLLIQLVFPVKNGRIQFSHDLRKLHTHHPRFKLRQGHANRILRPGSAPLGVEEKDAWISKKAL